MKKIICGVLSIVLLLALLVGCDETENTTTGTTASPTTTKPTTTTTVATTIPEPSNYDFLSDRGMGDCVSLKGDVMLYFVLVDDTESEWTDIAVKKFKAYQEIQMRDLMAQADRYGAKLNLKSKYVQGKISVPFDKDNYSLAADKALSQTPYVFDFAAVRDIKEDFNVDEAVVIFAINKDARSFAISSTNDWMNRFEYVVLYGNNSEYALNHELLHVFGAKDLYYPEEFKKAAEKHFGGSIMIDSTDDVDDLTAYLVGWTDKLSDKAQAFLDETADITDDYVDDAHKDNVITGEGTVDFGDRVYTGELKDGLPHGKGKMTTDSGFIYDGEWEYGEYQGYGVYTQPDGTVLKGEWKDGVLTGKGSAKYATGNSYEGYFVNFQAHGKGKFTFSDGGVYEGDFLYGLFHGKGKLTYSDGSCYDGEWKNDDYDGYGTMVWANGDKYVGYWSKGKLHGKGTYTYANGEVLSGTFYNNNFYG